MREFKDRVAVITGGASGIGLGMAQAFADRGMKLVLADVDQGALDTAVAQFKANGIEAIGQHCDVSKLEAVQALAQTTLDTYGAVHVLCNNAGVGLTTSTMNIKLEDWRWMIDIDLWGPIYGIEVFLPLIEQQGEGHVCSTSSMAGLTSSRSLGAYNVAKRGVVALMTTLERELRSRNSAITASVLCPGPINTNISSNSVANRPARPDSSTPRKPRDPAAQAIADRKQAKIQALLEEGMQPLEVGNLVADAIANDKFWILTHPEWIKGLQKELDAMRDDQTLTKG
ncbi:MAG: SDR family NAD(P)-dependent oxidoreductase [Pseudomonadales bacterium]